jgi:hypothetical chaperone protein
MTAQRQSARPRVPPLIAGNDMSQSASLGLDFGTTNSVATLINPQGESQAIGFSHDGDTVQACRSVMTFWREEEGRLSVPKMEIGPWAIDEFLELDGDCRFIQSFKTFAASPLFVNTVINNKAWSFEDLLSAFLRRLGERAGSPFPKRVFVGRPVRFAGTRSDDTLARTRYDAALSKAGFDDINHVYEPVAAAFFFAQRLERDATILVADFGGGTSDFSIIRFKRGAKTKSAQALAHRGIGIAGDNFDQRIIDNVVSPLFGKGSDYTSDGKILPVPKAFYARFAQWNQLSIMRHTRDYQDLIKLERQANEPAKIQAFIDFLDAEASYLLYRAVANAKTALSHADTTQFHLTIGKNRLQQSLTRADFESWIAPDLAEIDACVSDSLLAAGLNEGGIDRVFLTGGSSYVPAVKRQFEDRFGAGKVETGDQFVSIAHGLSLIAQEDDPSAWLA